jgi:hypothetical protein
MVEETGKQHRGEETTIVLEFNEGKTSIGENEAIHSGVSCGNCHQQGTRGV